MRKWRRPPSEVIIYLFIINWIGSEFIYLLYEAWLGERSPYGSQDGRSKQNRKPSSGLVRFSRLNAQDPLISSSLHSKSDRWRPSKRTDDQRSSRTSSAAWALRTLRCQRRRRKYLQFELNMPELLFQNALLVFFIESSHFSHTCMC